MSDYVLTKIDGLATEYTVEPDANDLYVMEHIVSGQTCKMKHSTMRSLFLSTSTASTVNANSTWNDNKYIRIGTDADLQMYFDGTNFQMKNVTSNSDIIITASPGGVATEIFRINGTTGSLKMSNAYMSNTGAATTGLHFTATEVHCTQLFQCESKLKIQNNMICGANYINYSGNSSAGLNFDSNEYAWFTNRVYASDLLIANSKIYAKDSISYSGTGGLTFAASGNATQTGTLTVTGAITAQSTVEVGTNSISYGSTGGITFDSSANMTQTGTLTCTKKIYANSATLGDIEARLKFICNGTNGITQERVIAVGNVLGFTGGICTKFNLS